MHTVSSAATRVIGVGLLLMGAVACTADEPTSDEASVSQPIVPAQTAPAARLSPFCQSMNDITERVESDPPDDLAAFLIESYRSLVDEVPDAIAVDFAAVLADLEGNPVTPPSTEAITPSSEPATPETTTAEPTAPEQTPTDTATVTGSTVGPLEGDQLPDEGYAPGETPAARVNAYVAFVCRDTANNPGPPATEPAVAPGTTAP